MLNNLVLLGILNLSAAHLTEAHPGNATEGYKNGPRERIVSGLGASHRQYPYMVALVRGYSTVTCGGAIVSYKTIATACHCVANIHGSPVRLYYPEDYHVIAGTSDLFGNSAYKVTARVRLFRIHPQCGSLDRTVAVFDAAVVVLKNSLQYNVEVRPITMYSFDTWTLMKEYTRLVNLGTKCITAGWGRTREFMLTEGTTFGAASLLLLSPEKCRKMLCPFSDLYCRLDIDRWQQLCTISSVNAVPCRGDTGGPLVCNGYIFGVFSWNIRCKTDRPQVFASPAAVWHVIAYQMTWEAGGLQRSRDKIARSSGLTTSRNRSANIVVLIILALVAK